MDAFTMQMVNQEISNPSSPYYIGKKNFPGGVNGLLGTPYNTNFLGLNKNVYLGQPNVDMVQLSNNNKKARMKDTILKLVGGTLVAVYSLAILRKIPVLNIIPKALGVAAVGIPTGTAYGAAKTGSGIWKLHKWLFSNKTLSQVFGRGV